MTEASTGPRRVSAKPVGYHSPPPTGRQELDQRLSRLTEGARAFARISPAEKALLLHASRARFLELAPRQVELGCMAKGIDPESALAGEEWFTGPAISIRALRLFAAALEDVQRLGAPRLARGRSARLPNGRTRVSLVPHDAYDRFLYREWKCDAWLPGSMAPERVKDAQAHFYRRRDPEGRVVLVLGAGNVGSISVLDVLYHSFVEGAVCLLKMSPVNDYLGPLYEQAFAPLIERGFLALAYGGADVGGYLVAHPAVQALHVTGSVDTHDALVWGPPGPEREARKQAGRPLLDKPVTSELGNLTPILVVPGAYSDRELDAAARSIAGMATNNAGYNCVAARIVVCARGWPQRDALLERLGQVLAQTPPRSAYYPGARARFHELVGSAPADRVHRYGEPGPDELPWALVSDLDPGADTRLFRVEPFCSLLMETALDTSDPIEFLDAASAFANDRLWGTLCAMLIAPDRLSADAATARALERSVETLRYGTVAINLWPAIAYGLGLPPWGGYPGATLSDVQSGIGWGHDAWLLHGVEKVVLRGPLLGFPQPFWYPGRPRLAELGRTLATLEAEQSPTSALRAAWAALR